MVVVVVSISVGLGRSVHGGTENLFELNPLTRYTKIKDTNVIMR